MCRGELRGVISNRDDMVVSLLKNGLDRIEIAFAKGVTLLFFFGNKHIGQSTRLNGSQCLLVEMCKELCRTFEGFLKGFLRSGLRKYEYGSS